MHEQFPSSQWLDELLFVAWSFDTHIFLVFPSNFKLSLENKYENNLESKAIPLR